MNNNKELIFLDHKLKEVEWKCQKSLITKNGWLTLASKFRQMSLAYSWGLNFKHFCQRLKPTAQFQARVKAPVS